jgi:hypothetical protein
MWDLLRGGDRGQVTRPVRGVSELTVLLSVHLDLERS